MLQYKAGYKFVDGGVHAQVLDFPAAISCGADLAEARRMLGLALIDVAETLLAQGEALPKPDPTVSDPEMDLEEPLYLHLKASSEVSEEPAGVVVP
jgi:predicted RNase H-like HicB family nuclease